MNTESSSHIETELTLVICSDDAERVCESVEALPSVAGLRASDVLVQSICDVYYDTTDRRLRAAGWGLRIREVGPDCYLALKGRTKVTDRGAVERIEIEGEWSLGILNAVVDQLSGLWPVPEYERTFARFSPHATLSCLGFTIIQDRKTTRKARNLTREPERGSGPDAELVIDRVVYSFQGHELIHHEIEIEAVSPLGAELIPLVQDDLVARFGKSLRPWLHSKLATGWALERLLAEGRLNELVKDGLLAPAAYDMIDEKLTREAVPHP